MIYEKNRPKNAIHLPTMPLWHETVNILYLGPLPRVILNPTIWCRLCLKKIGSHACFQSEHFPPLRALNRHTFHLDSSSAHQPPLLNLNKSSQAPDPLLVSNACLFMVRLQKSFHQFPALSSVSNRPVHSPLLNVNRLPSHPVHLNISPRAFSQTAFQNVKDSGGLLSQHVFISLFASPTRCILQMTQ